MSSQIPETMKDEENGSRRVSLERQRHSQSLKIRLSDLPSAMRDSLADHDADGDGYVDMKELIGLSHLFKAEKKKARDSERSKPLPSALQYSEHLVSSVNIYSHNFGG